LTANTAPAIWVETSLQHHCMLLSISTIMGKRIMPKMSQDKLNVHVNVEITAAALQAIVANAKKIAPKDANGTYRIDTADQVSAIISRFLDEKNFDDYVLNIDNYS
jgi:ribosome maturation factor RimP